MKKVKLRRVHPSQLHLNQFVNLELLLKISEGDLRCNSHSLFDPGCPGTINCSIMWDVHTNVLFQA